MIRISQTEEKGLAFFDMETDRIRAKVTNLGCHILSLKTRDRDGKFEDIVLGYEHVEDCFTENSCMGAIVGRVANRIGHAAFSLNGKEYRLAANCGPHHLHGGLEGFDRKRFDYEVLDDGIRFHYLSADMEEGYPGNLDLTVTYRVNGSRFSIAYHAVTDRDTLINVTNHTYFNLSGEGEGREAFKEKIDGHRLMIDADRIACVDENGLAYGDYLPVAGTPFDFQDFHEIGERIGADHPQIRNAGGYDHSFILNPPSSRAGAVLMHQGTGRKVSVFTSFPVIQVYTANFLAGGCRGRHGAPYQNRDGVALEAQFVSNSIQIEEAPRVILRAGQPWDQETVWAFENC